MITDECAKYCNRKSGNLRRTVTELDFVKSYSGTLAHHLFCWTLAFAYPGILFGGGEQIQLRTEDRENGDLGALAP